MKDKTNNTKPNGMAKKKSPTNREKYSADNLCSTFLDFFEAKKHRIVASAPLLPEDPTLLFTAAGMVPFKSFYSDPDNAPYTRAASVQKCLRAGGKQSDLENVGRTLRHHSFFEMLGNFSFGDYFKKEAIDFAWELSVDVWPLEVERIWVSIYHDDDEAHEIWTRRIGFPSSRVVRLGKADNFWGPVGETGICGPCSELYYDCGPEKGCGKDTCKPGCDCDRFIEYWNLVFPQFNYSEDGKYDPLPKPGIDTGLGLERLAYILQQAQDNFHTDHFLPVRRAVIDALPGKKEVEGAAQPINVATDHVRALTFTLAEGILPSNEGRGYILRRLLRRAVTKLHPFGVKKPFLSHAVDAVIRTMKTRYPELEDRADFIKQIVVAEEERFLSTMQQGMDKLRTIIDATKKKKQTMITGREAFLLYDTFGFPMELTEELALDSGLTVDTEGFSAAMSEQKERARSRSFHLGSGKQSEFIVRQDARRSDFLGYDSLSCEATVTAFRITANGEQSRNEQDGHRWPAEVITDQTVFYAESGGQVGDKGTMRIASREVQVTGAYPLNDQIIHRIKWWEQPEEDAMRTLFDANPTVRLTVDRERRLATARNHTGTHLMHAALRQVLGEHVVQAGSLVDPERLRFDFHHYQAMKADEMSRVEEIVNRIILDNREVTAKEMPYQKAVEAGAIALFGEKYTDMVRVISVDGFSRELCGGTHLDRTGEIGLFILKQESAVAAGVRRIEALTGEGALLYVEQLVSSRNRLAGMLKVAPDDIENRVANMLTEQATLKKRLASKEGTLAGKRLDAALAAAVEVNAIKLISLQIEAPDVPSLRKFGDRLREKLDAGVGLICQEKAEKPILLIVVSDRLIKDRGIKANELAASIGDEFSFRGGGKPHMAQMGLGNSGDLVKIEDFVKSKLAATD
jgi:alanyl-tRNA synthetase